MKNSEFTTIKCNGFTIKPVAIGWNNCPWLKIAITTPDGEEIDHGYLMPFRKYKLQICGTKDGQWDKGSTPVFGLDTFNHIIQSGPSNVDQDDTVKYILSSVVKDAVLQFAPSVWMCAEEDAEGHHPTYYKLKGFDYKRYYSRTSMFDMYIEALYRFIQEGCNYTEKDEIPMWFLELTCNDEEEE